MKTLLERRKDRLRRFTQNSLKGKGHWISYIYCERLNLLLRKLNDLTTTIGVAREKSKAGTLSKRLEKPSPHIPNKTSTDTPNREAVSCKEISAVFNKTGIVLSSLAWSFFVQPPLPRSASPLSPVRIRSRIRFRSRLA
jgi:hypothetical protein